MDTREQGKLSIRESLAMYKKVERLIPGGSQLLSRRPIRFAYGVYPIFAQRAKGAYFWDIDGNEYLDMTMAVDIVLANPGSLKGDF